MPKFTSDDTLASWFAYHPPATPEVAQAHESVRGWFGNLAELLNDLLPECPDKTVALRAVRESYVPRQRVHRSSAEAVRAVTCPGPLIWFDVTDDDNHDSAAVLECATCGYVVTTGNLHDEVHADTPLLREGIATA